MGTIKGMSNKRLLLRKQVWKKAVWAEGRLPPSSQLSPDAGLSETPVKNPGVKSQQWGPRLGCRVLISQFICTGRGSNPSTLPPPTPDSPPPDQTTRLRGTVRNCQGRLRTLRLNYRPHRRGSAGMRHVASCCASLSPPPLHASKPTAHGEAGARPLSHTPWRADTVSSPRPASGNADRQRPRRNALRAPAQQGGASIFCRAHRHRRSGAGSARERRSRALANPTAEKPATARGKGSRWGDPTGPRHTSLGVRAFLCALIQGQRRQHVIRRALLRPERTRLPRQDGLKLGHLGTRITQACVTASPFRHGLRANCLQACINLAPSR